MTEPEPEVWVLITQDGTVTAYDTQDAAISAAADETDPWIECVQVTTGPQAAEQDENALRTAQPANRPQTGAHSIHVPTGTGMTSFYNPWTDGAA